MMRLADYAISGNHDLACIGRIDLQDFNPDARVANEWNGFQLTPEHLEWLRNLDHHIERLDMFPDYTLAHGSPREPVWEYLLTVEQALANFDHPHFRTQVCFIGHSHVPLYFRNDYDRGCQRRFPDNGDVIELVRDVRYIVNPGSVGQPRNQDPRAAYAVLDTQAATIKFHRVEYDVAITQKQMRDAGLPFALVRRLSFGM
jgi:diadenosine tetraphosphatase ApaH/serine/threonine PP2A family protein phosphatase